MFKHQPKRRYIYKDKYIKITIRSHLGSSSSRSFRPSSSPVHIMQMPDPAVARLCTVCRCRIPAYRADWHICLCRWCHAAAAAEERAARQARKGKAWHKGKLGKGKAQAKGKGKGGQGQAAGKGKGKDKDKGEGLEGLADAAGKGKGKDKGKGEFEDLVIDVARTRPGVPGSSEPHCREDMSEDMDAEADDMSFLDLCVKGMQ